MRPRVTFIQHCWNEAGFMLPHWLRHHLPMADHGIFVDYNSDDGSMDVVRKMAPTWEIRQSRNKEFSALDVDREIEEIERTIPDYKIVLNTTEYLVAPNLRDYVSWMSRYRPDVQGIWAWDYEAVDPPHLRNVPIEPDVSLIRQRHHGFHPVHGDRSRMLHRAPSGLYAAGRHQSGVVGKHLDRGLFVTRYRFSPMAHVVPRLMQIQTRIPPGDKARQWGWQHLLTGETLEAQYQEAAAHSTDLFAQDPEYADAVSRCHLQ